MRPPAIITDSKNHQSQFKKLEESPSANITHTHTHLLQETDIAQTVCYTLAENSHHIITQITLTTLTAPITRTTHITLIALTIVTTEAT